MLIWILTDNDISKYQTFRTLISRFSREYPDLKVSFEIKSKKALWRSFFKFLRDPQKNPVADVVEIPHNWTAVFARLGMFLELETVLNGLNAQEYPAFLREGMRADEGERSFSVPFWAEAQTLHYRRDMLRAAGAEANMSMLGWPEFNEICLKLKEKNRRKDFYPLDNFNPHGVESDDALACVLNRGAFGYFSRDLGSCETMKEEVTAGLEDYLDLFSKRYMPVFQENFQEAAFIESRLSAMAFSWRLPIKIGKSQMEIVPLPNLRRRTNIVRSFNLAVTCGCRAADEAGLFINWLLKAENGGFFRKQLKVFACREKELKKQLESSPQAYSDIFAGASMVPNFPVYPTFDIILSGALFETALEILRGDYHRENLLKRLAVIKGEADYLLSIY